MTILRPLFFGILLCASAMALSAGDAAAKQKLTWSQECRKAGSAEKRQQCCRRKQAECNRPCNDMQGDLSPPDGGPPYDPISIKHCFDRCRMKRERCEYDVRRALTRPGGAVSTGSRTGPYSERRVCCRTGRRHGWARPRDCRARKGRIVETRHCRRPDRRIDRRGR